MNEKKEKRGTLRKRGTLTIFFAGAGIEAYRFKKNG